MDQLPYFLRLLEHDNVISKVVTTHKIQEDDLVNCTYDRGSFNSIKLKDFNLNDEEKFKNVDIFITSFGVLIDFISDDVKYFENTLYYFNSNRQVKLKPPYIIKGREYIVKGRKTGEYEIFDKLVQGTVLQSELYGCKIMLSFSKKTYSRD